MFVSHTLVIAHDRNRVFKARANTARKQQGKLVYGGQAVLIGSGEMHVLRRVEVENTIPSGRVARVAQLMFASAHDEIVLAVVVGYYFFHALVGNTARFVFLI